MTVISTMKFNEEEAAIIADEQASGGNRKEDIFLKLYEVKAPDMQSVIGGSGVGVIITDIIEKMPGVIEANANSIKSPEDFANVLAQITAEKRGEIISAQVYSQFGITQMELIAGVIKESGLKIADQVMNDYIGYMKNIQREQHLGNGFIMLTEKDTKVNVYAVGMGNQKAVSIPGQYYSIGSGSDLASPALSAFIQSMSREKRSNIDPVDGIAVLLNSTEIASSQNQGVGGIPYIKIIKDGQIITPDENTSKLLYEIAKGTNADQLSGEFQREAIGNLVYNGGKFNAIEKQMWKEASDKKALDLLLRGYRQ